MYQGLLARLRVCVGHAQTRARPRNRGVARHRRGDAGDLSAAVSRRRAAGKLTPMPRAEPPVAGDETATMLGSLERQRAIFAWKCGGLDAAGLTATAGASSMTLGGLLKHLALVEDEYFTRRLLGREYARHTGHADLIRESVDGLTGEDPPD